MPPPSYCSKISTQSTNDHATDNDFNNSKTDISSFLEAHSSLDFKPTLKRETINFVKTLLGPSLEDAILKTLNFGKTLIQKPDGPESVSKEKKLFEAFKKEISDNPKKQLDLNFLLEKGRKIEEMKEDKNFFEGKPSRKNIKFNKEKDKNLPLCQKSKKPVKKFAKVSKIRSLDSDLKQKSLSPEKIKRQLEALIQINKDVPPEHAVNWNYCSKTPKMPMEMTVMPSFYMYDNKTDLNCPSSCDTQSNTSKLECDGDPTTSSKMRPRMRHPSKLCQAPEFLSNALGPTLDVSLIDNIKMMRDIFKCDSARGEGPPKRPICQQMKQEVRLQNSEAEMNCRIEELQRRIEELEQKERCLAKQIEDEEQEREWKRKAFEEEERKQRNMKLCFEQAAANKKGDWEASLMEFGYESKRESLQSRIACEEERLSRLKAQNDNYKREIIEAKSRKEALKRNKALLDAWDVIASRICHTRLPSFSRVYNLERRNFKIGDTGNVHCCFPTISPRAPERPKSPCARSRSRSRDRCGKSDCQCASATPSLCASQGFGKSESQCPSRSESRGNNDSCGNCREHAKNESFANLKCKLKMGEIQFPVQRDITCGLHQMLKTCSCKYKGAMKHEGHVCRSEDDLLKRYNAMNQRGSKQEHYFSSLGLDSSADLIMRKSSKEKATCRSKSDTSLKKEKCSRIVKVMWATTRINIFQDNCRTYEIMDATSRAPAFIPAKTEGIFVVKTPQKKVCPSSSKRKCHPSVP